MKGILMRDGLVLYKKYLRFPLVILSSLGLLFTFMMGFPISSLLSLLIPLGIGARIVYVFAEDEKDNWLKELKTLPISSAQAVGSRFILFTSIIFGCSLYSLCLNLIAFLLYKEQPLSFYFVFPILGFVFAVFNNFLLLPTCYKFGVQGANVVCMSILILTGMIAFGIKKLNLKDWINFYETVPQYVVFLSIAVVFILVGIFSIKLSIFIYDKSEVI